MIDPSLTSVEILGVAIKSEIHAAQIYERLLDLVTNRALKERLQFLKREEEAHRRLLEELYKNSFPDAELKLPQKSFVPMELTTKEGVTVPELLQLAMNAEEVSERFYNQMAERSKDHSGKVLLMYLSKMEQGHYHLLKNEYRLISQFPDYYKVEDFDLGQQAIHLGP